MSLWKCPLCTKPTRLVGFYSADSLKQHSVGRHVLHWDTLLPWFWTSQSLIFLLIDVSLVEKQHILIPIL